MFSTAYKTGVSWNDSFWSNARFDELLLQARAELDESKRRAMYYEMQQTRQPGWRRHRTHVCLLRVRDLERDRSRWRLWLQLGYGWRALGRALVFRIILP